MPYVINTTQTLLNRTAIKRLIKIRNFLRDQVKDEQFNLNRWSDSDELGVPKNQIPQIGCSMSACVGGWTPACFPRSRFTFDRFGTVEYRDQDGLLLEGFAAMAKFYHISYKDAQHIGLPSTYPGWDEDLDEDDPKNVATISREAVVSRITTFIDRMVRTDETRKWIVRPTYALEIW